jgi:hypothetical protein
MIPNYIKIVQRSRYILNLKTGYMYEKKSSTTNKLIET